MFTVSQINSIMCTKRKTYAERTQTSYPHNTTHTDASPETLGLYEYNPQREINRKT